MKRYVLTALILAMLGACGSSVKLDNVPVEDKSGVALVSQSAAPVSPDGAAVSKGGVATVDLSKNTTDAAIQSMNRVVYFDYDSFAIRPEFQNVIESHARFLKAEKNRKVVIGGHTDERGGRRRSRAGTRTTDDDVAGPRPPPTRPQPRPRRPPPPSPAPSRRRRSS